MAFRSDLSATRTAAVEDLRPAVTVLAGFAPSATHAVARALLHADPDLLLVRHDLDGVLRGQVQRVVRTSGGLLEDVTVELVHGCVQCTLREDVLPTLARLSREHPGRDLVLVLPPAVDPESLAAACAGHPVTESVRFDSYVTVVDAATVLDDLTSTDDLRHRGMHAAHDDHRGVAELLVRQVEYADTVVLWADPDADGFELARMGTLLHRLAPWATHFTDGVTPVVDCARMTRRLRDTRRHDPNVPGMLGRVMEGFSIGVHEPAADCGVVSVLFHARRPFHPQRLHDALEDLTGEALRSRGQCWIASQPDGAVGWESAGGGVALGTLGFWLAALPTHRWDEATTLRRLAANLNWDPYYGDRGTSLVFIGLHLDPAAITDLLRACLLTDDEVAGGFDAWRDLPDPFANCFPLFEKD
ncbi:CobW family GTP-binding protein [Dactylosporangium sp. NPDC048998]|uniref:CobW family GTP-binding protein n=1 Tax=Dactylosporangium sp. NPDC048998 TaxID=3363976 RepID=UPI00371D75BC